MVLAQDESVGDLDLVMTFDGAMPTGVAVSRTQRVFVCFPRWDDPVEFTVAELRSGHLVPFPDLDIQQPTNADPTAGLISVQSVVVDARDRLWILDTGAPRHQTTSFGGPKLVEVDLTQDRVIRTILFPADVALSTTYLNDVRFDLRRGAAGTAYITDSSPVRSGLIVVDLASSRSWRKLDNHASAKAEPGFLPVVEGRPLMLRPPNGVPQPYRTGADGIALSADGTRLFYSALMGRRLYSVSTEALVDQAANDDAVAATILDEGDKGGGGDGMESDAEGSIYTTNYEHNAILRRRPDGLYEPLAHAPHLLWPDTLALGPDRYLYFTVNQLHRGPRFHGGHDLRQRPFGLLRVRVEGSPVGRS